MQIAIFLQKLGKSCQASYNRDAFLLLNCVVVRTSSFCFKVN